MKTCLPFAFFTILLVACQSDASRKADFAGTYEVTIEAPDAKKDLKKAKKDVGKEIAKAKEEIRGEIDKAKKDIENEFGEDSNFGEAISHLVEGMGKFAEGMTELGEELSHLGIDLGTGILGSIRFNAEFHKNGDVEFGRRSRGIRIHGGDEIRWDIRDGEFFLWNEGGEEKATPYKMKKISSDEWELVGDDVIFHLKKSEQ